MVHVFSDASLVGHVVRVVISVRETSADRLINVHDVGVVVPAVGVGGNCHVLIHEVRAVFLKRKVSSAAT